MSAKKKAPKFSHLDSDGRATMVDVGQKPVQRRSASAGCVVHCKASTIDALRSASLPKGDVLTVAKIAGIQAAKRTDSLIPLCHQIALSVVEVEFTLGDEAVGIVCTAVTDAKTGVEMEALVGASVAALTVYDMCKAVDKTMVVSDLKVLEKVKQ
jgi:cyclic pyranopterin phosphate synthase